MEGRLDYVFIYFSNLGSGFLEDEWNQIVKRCCIRMYTFGSKSSVLMTMGMLKKD